MHGASMAFCRPSEVNSFLSFLEGLGFAFAFLLRNAFSFFVGFPNFWCFF